jgi:hypothetical protein
VAPKRKTVVKALSALVGTEELVRVRRGIRKADRVEGFVVGVGEQWVLLNLFDPDMFLDGYVALRLRDIRRVERRGGPDSFPLRALQHFGQSRRPLKGVDLDTIDGLLASLGSVYPLLLVYVEELHPEVCYVGKYVSTSKRNLRLLEISPRATWDDKPTEWPLKAISRVEVGTRYAEALHAVGGKPSE